MDQEKNEPINPIEDENVRQVTGGAQVQLNLEPVSVCRACQRVFKGRVTQCPSCSSANIDHYYKKTGE